MSSMVETEHTNGRADLVGKAGHAALLLPIILHILIAVPLAYVLNIWADEASTLYSTERGIGFALRNTLADEKQAPLYFWVLSAWRLISSSVFFARLFSVICAVAGIALFFKLARRFVSDRAAFFLTFFFALHPFLIWASLEIRVYALVIALSLLLADLFFRDFFESEDAVPIRAAARFCAVSVVGLYSNYYLGFLLAAFFAALVATGRWRAARAYFLTMLVVAICFAPLVFAVRSQFAANTVAFQSERSVIIGLQVIWNTLLTFTVPTEIFPPEQISTLSLIRVWVVRFALIVLIAVVVRRRRELLERKLAALAVAVPVVLVFFFVAYLLLGEVYVAIRHASVIFAPVVLFAGVLFARLVPRRIAPVFAVIWLALFAYSVQALYPQLAKRGDWARVGAFIAANERPGQPIIVFTTFDALALPYHYRGANRILPDEKFFDWEIEAPAGTADAWRRQTEFIIGEIPPDADEIWLVTNEKCAVQDSCVPLENFVGQNYTIVIEKEFYLEKVRLLRKIR